MGLVGRIQSSNEVTLSSPFESTIQKVLVHEGEMVKKGQTIITLNPDLIYIELRDAESELIKSKEDLIRLQRWESSPDVIHSKRAVESARSILSNTRINLRDTTSLFRQGIVARMEVDSLIQQETTQKQDLLNAIDDLKNIKGRVTDQEIKISKMKLLNAKTKYLSIKKLSAQNNIRAPFSGIVAKADTTDSGKTTFPQEGTLIGKGSALLNVINLEQYQVLTQVNETDLNILHEGLPVEITGDGFPNLTLNGKIISISSNAEPMDSPIGSAVYPVIASINPNLTSYNESIRLGMSAKIAVILYLNNNAIVVPPDTIHVDDKTTWVWFKKTQNSEISKKKIIIGNTVPEGIEIKGIESGYIGNGNFEYN